MRAQRYHLLLIEDDPADWMLFEALIADEGGHTFEMTRVATITEAQALVDTTDFDLLVVDLHLPDTDGWATFERVAPLCSQMPVVLLSSLVDETFADRAVRAGAQNYLIKGEASGRLLVRLLLHAIERHRIQRLLAESEESFRWLVDGLADGLILLNQRGEAVLINRAAREMFADGVDIAAAAGRLATVNSNDEIVLDGARGQYAEVRVTTLSWQGQRVRAISLRDVSERRRVAELSSRVRVQRERARQLQKMSEMKSEMLTRLTHELRTPMTPLRSILEVLAEGTPGPINDEQRVLIELLQSNVERLSRFATQVMTTASLEAQAEAGPPTRLEIPGQLESTLALMRASAEADVEVEISTDVSAEAWMSLDDLSRVVVNLLTNAQMHNQLPVRTRVSVRADDAWAVLVVEDDGRGIPVEAREAVFERFVQLDRRIGPGYQGSGLGLPICKALVERAGGRIEIESSPMGGAAIVLYLPKPPGDA